MRNHLYVYANKKRARRTQDPAGSYFLLLDRRYQVQAIRPFADEVHVFAVRVWEAAAVQPAG
jgi:hypothetical protein